MPQNGSRSTKVLKMNKLLSPEQIFHFDTTAIFETPENEAERSRRTRCTDAVS